MPQCKHTKKADDAAANEEKAKALSHGKQRDQKIYLTQEVWAKRELFSTECKKFLIGLLTRDVNKRLGSGAGGFRAIKDHDWFEPLDWDRLAEGTVTAPYIPKKEVNAKEEAKMKTCAATPRPRHLCPTLTPLPLWLTPARPLACTLASRRPTTCS